MPKPNIVSSGILERLRALDPAEPGSAAALMDIVIALEEQELSAEEAKAIYADIDRITREINQRHVAKR